MAAGRIQNMLFYRDLITLYPSHCYQSEYFSGDFEMLPFFMQLPVKHKILMNYGSNPRTQQALLDTTLEDTVTDRLEFYMSRHIRHNEKIIEWMLNTCVNLTKLFCVNFPDNGVHFLNQKLSIQETKLEKIALWDNLNTEFFNDLIDKSRYTLKEIIYFTVDPDLFIDHLDPYTLEVLEVRNMNESVFQFLKLTRKLTRLKLL